MSVADLLKGGGSFLKWETPGTSYEGTITAVEARQANKYKTTEPDTWQDGTPKMQIVLTLATDYRDTGIDEDDGTRLLSVNAWGGQKTSLREACRAIGVTEPRVGMGLKVTHTKGIGNADSPREFEYVLTPAPTDVSGLIEAPAAVPAPPAPPAPAAAVPAPPPPAAAAPAVSMDDVEAHLRAGWTPQQVAEKFGIHINLATAKLNEITAASA